MQIQVHAVGGGIVALEDQLAGGGEYLHVHHVAGGRVFDAEDIGYGVGIYVEALSGSFCYGSGGIGVSGEAGVVANDLGNQIGHETGLVGVGQGVKGDHFERKARVNGCHQEGARGLVKGG